MEQRLEVCASLHSCRRVRVSYSSVGGTICKTGWPFIEVKAAFLLRSAAFFVKGDGTT